MAENKDDKKKEISLDPTNNESGTTDSDSIIEEAKKLTQRRRGTKTKNRGGRPAKKSRRTDEEIEKDKQLKDMEKTANALLQSSFAAIVSIATTQLVYLTDDLKWRSSEQEQNDLAVCFLGYCDVKFRGWRSKSPEVALALAVMAFIAPRIAITEKKSPKDNPYKNWFSKAWHKMKGSSTDSGLTKLLKKSEDSKK